MHGYSMLHVQHCWLYLHYLVAASAQSLHKANLSRAARPGKQVKRYRQSNRAQRSHDIPHLHIMCRSPIAGVHSPSSPVSPNAFLPRAARSVSHIVLCTPHQTLSRMLVKRYIASASHLAQQNLTQNTFCIQAMHSTYLRTLSIKQQSPPDGALALSGSTQAKKNLSAINTDIIHTAGQCLQGTVVAGLHQTCKVLSMLFYIVCPV